MRNIFKTLWQKMNKPVKRFGDQNIFGIISMVVIITPFLITLQSRVATSNQATRIDQAKLSSITQSERSKIAIDTLGDINITDISKLNNISSKLTTEIAGINFTGNNTITLNEGYEVSAKIPQVKDAKFVDIYYGAASGAEDASTARISVVGYSVKRDLAVENNFVDAAYGTYIRAISTDANAASTTSTTGTNMLTKLNAGNVTGANTDMANALLTLGGPNTWAIIKFSDPTKLNKLAIENSATSNTKPNKTIELTFSDGTIYRFTLSQTGRNVFQFPTVTTKEVKVKVIDNYVLAQAPSVFFPTAYAALTSSEKLQEYIEGSKNAILKASNAWNAAEMYANAIDGGVQAGFLSSEISSGINDTMSSKLLSMSVTNSYSQVIGEYRLLVFLNNVVDKFVYSNSSTVQSMFDSMLNPINWSSLATVGNTVGVPVPQGISITTVQVFTDAKTAVTNRFNTKKAAVLALNTEKVARQQKENIQFQMDQISQCTTIACLNTLDTNISAVIATMDSGVQGYYTALKGQMISTRKGQLVSSGNRSIQFNGTSSVATLPSDISLGSKSFSISWWMKRTANRHDTIFSRSQSATNGYIGIDKTNNSVYIRSNSGTWETAFPTGINTADGSWHFYTLTFGTSASKLYVDGGLKSTQATSSDVNNFIIRYFGTAQYTPTYSGWFSGELDEVRIYSRELPDTEVANISSRLYMNNTGLVGYWDCNETTGVTITDQSTSLRHGTLSNITRMDLPTSLMGSVNYSSAGAVTNFSERDTVEKKQLFVNALSGTFLDTSYSLITTTASGTVLDETKALTQELIAPTPLNVEASSISTSLTGASLQNEKIKRFINMLANNVSLSKTADTFTPGSTFTSQSVNIAGLSAIASTSAVAQQSGSVGFSLFALSYSAEVVKIKDGAGNTIGTVMGPETRMYIDVTKGSASDDGLYKKMIRVPVSETQTSILKLYPLNKNMSFKVVLEKVDGTKLPIIIRGGQESQAKNGVGLTNVSLQKVPISQRDYTVKTNELFTK